MTRRDVRVLLFLIGLPSILFLGPLFTGRTHFMGDVMRSFHPWLSVAAQEIQAGRLPFWNPYAALGEPLLANPQVMAFFPPAQLFWLFPFADAWRFFFLLSQALMTAALYFLYRRDGRAGAAVGALAVAWGGFVLIHWEFPGALATMPFVAFFLLFAARGFRMMIPLATALLFLAGYTQFAYYAVLAGGCVLLARAIRRRDVRTLWDGAAFLFGGLVLAAPQIMASMEVVRESTRTLLSREEMRAHLLTPILLLKLLIPGIHDKALSPYAGMVFDPSLWPLKWNWLTTFYAGVTAPVLALAAWRKKKAWAAIALGSLALALGLEPLTDLLRAAVPGMRYMTHFSNVMLIFLIALGALAAGGLRELDQRRAVVRSWLAAGAAVSLFLAAVPPARTWVMEQMLGLESLAAGQHRWVVRASLSAAGLCAAAGALTFLRKGRAAALLLFTLADLWWFGRDLQPTVPDGFYREPVPLARILQGREDRFSIDPLLVREGARPLDGATPEAGYQSLRQALYLNMQAPFRIHQTWSYEVFPNRRFTEVRHKLDVENPWGPLLDFTGARYVLSVRKLPPPAVYKAHRPNAILYENPGALPRVLWVPKARTAADPLALMGPDWEPREDIILEEGAAAGRPPTPTVPVFSPDVRPGRMRAEGRSDGGWLLWSQVRYPGWEAWVNGKKVPLLRANHAFQAAALPEGDWRAVFIYRPTAVWRAILAATVFWTIAAFGLLGFLRKL